MRSQSAEGTVDEEPPSHGHSPSAGAEAGGGDGAV